MKLEVGNLSLNALNPIVLLILHFTFNKEIKILRDRVVVRFTTAKS